ncbi:MAG TPA: hypothetical protein VI110_02265 [Lapillicoccus sp.]
MWDTVFPYLAALLPTVAVGALFYFLIKSILEGDRRERLAHSKWERDQEREREKEREQELGRTKERDAPNIAPNSPSRPE